MRIQHNIMAMNSYRNYTNNASALSKNLEKLSSGYKINRAGDDAAGLAISEKMRAQIQGLNAAQKNVKDGISLVKTAEGAMQEIQDMLSRMKYLATQSANGTYDNDVDRAALQDEVDSLRAEINRIADSANFNGTNLLDGGKSAGTTGETEKVATFEAVDGASYGASFGAGSLTGFGSTASVSITGATEDHDGIEIEFVFSAGATTGNTGSTDSASVSADFSSGKLTITIQQAGTNGGTGFAGGTDINELIQNAIDQAIAANDELEGLSITVSGFDADTIDDASSITTASATIGEDTTAATPASLGIEKLDISGAKDLEDEGEVTIDFDNATGELSITLGTVTYTATLEGNIKDYLTGGITLESDDNGSIKLELNEDSIFGLDGSATTGTKIGELTLEDKAGSGYVEVQLQIGDDSAAHNKLTFKIGDMHTTAMGAVSRDPTTNDDGYDTGTIYTLDDADRTIDNIDISDIDGANDALDVIKEAINYVSAVRGNLGAIQNRLEHTQNNLSVMAENIQDAESTIRDTDVADEMMGYVKNNILIQSAQAMLAQANQVPQGVLQLLG